MRRRWGKSPWRAVEPLENDRGSFRSLEDRLRHAQERSSFSATRWPSWRRRATAPPSTPTSCASVTLEELTDLLEAASSATAALSNEEEGAVDAITRAESELDRAARYDEGLEGLLNRVRSLSAELEDVVYELRSYFDELEADPSRLETVEDRLQNLRALERKYGEDVEGYLEEAKGRLARMEKLRGGNR